MCEYCPNEADRMVSSNSQYGEIKIRMCRVCYDRTQAKQKDRNIKFKLLNNEE